MDGNGTLTRFVAYEIALSLSLYRCSFDKAICKSCNFSMRFGRRCHGTWLTYGDILSQRF